MKKLIVRTLIIAVVTSLSAATASAQSMPSLSSLMEQFGMGSLAGAKLPQLPTTASAPKQDLRQLQAQLQPSSSAGQTPQADGSKAMDCINSFSNSFSEKIGELSKQMSTTKEGSVPLTAEQIAGVDAQLANLPMSKGGVVTRSKYAYTPEQEQIASAFIKNNSDFSGSSSLSNCFSK